MTRFSLLVGAALMAVLPLIAQADDSPFAPRIIINDRVVSHYEIEQRALFFQLLRAPGDPQKEALKGLVEDRLRQQEGARRGYVVKPADLEAGMTEFAGRANMDTETFLKALAQGGVEPETFRDFISAGLIWRQVVRDKFGGRSALTETQIDRAIEGATRKVALRVLLTELIIPAQPGQEEAALATARRIQSEVTTEAGFSAAVARYSEAASKGRGGRLDWMPLANLPASIAPFVLGLNPGEVSDALAIPGGVAVFQLRAAEEMPNPSPVPVAVEYATYLVANDANAAAELARVQGAVDACPALFAEAMGLPESQLTRVTQNMNEVPTDIALQLAQMDPGESSVDLMRGGNRVLLMLCSRQPGTEPLLDRNEVRKELLNRRLGAQADLYLAELRANAIIREP